MKRQKKPPDCSGGFLFCASCQSVAASAFLDIQPDSSDRFATAGEALPLGDKCQRHRRIVHLAGYQRSAAGAAIAAATLELHMMTMALQGLQHAFAGMGVQHGTIPGMYPWCHDRMLFGRCVRGRGQRVGGVTHSSKSPRSSALTSLSI